MITARCFSLIWLLASVVVCSNNRVLLDIEGSPSVEDDEYDDIDMSDAAMFSALSIVVDGSTLAGPETEEMDDIVGFGEDAARVSQVDLQAAKEQERVLALATDIYGQISGRTNAKAVKLVLDNVEAGEVAALGIAIASAATVDADSAASLIYQILRQELSIDELLDSLVFALEYGGEVSAELIALVLQKYTQEDPPYPGSELAFKIIAANYTMGRQVFDVVQLDLENNGCAGWSRLISGTLILGESSNSTEDVDNAVRQGKINNCITKFGPPTVPSSGLNNIGIADAESLAQTFLVEAQRFTQTGNSGPFVSPMDSAGLRYQVDDLADVFEEAISRSVGDELSLFSLSLALPELAGFAGPGVQLGLTKALNRVRLESGCAALGNLITFLTAKASEQKLFYQWSSAMEQEEGLFSCIGQSVDTCIGFALRDCCYPPEDGQDMPDRCSNCGFQLGCRFIQDRSSIKQIGYFVYMDQRFNENLCKCPMDPSLI
eukprot:TRINITY_DN17338_c0_g1_i2.p1 TRINITY_DN17338_c0_g1~~TRINITY_DN17338_c0_g1_i2.p1  ORF type:complete len:517 (+),score=107.84 TRINITY_DN17338_c0_g1_i2:80-1552(+)